jgi:Dyp-type peroxidase family
MSDRALVLDDIQGDILAGFNTDVQALVGLTAPDDAGRRTAAAWLASLAPEITSVARVRAERDVMKTPPAGEPPLTWLAVAVGPALLQAAARDVFILDDAFNEGMPDRAASALADRSLPAQWMVGAPSAPLDILLKIAGNDATAVEARRDTLVKAAKAKGLTAPYQEVGARLADNAEHFGFRDGISQPDVLGDQSATGLSPGNFVFGYPKAPGVAPPRRAVDPRNLTDNGSLLVFRRLAQDVPAFRAFCADQIKSLQPEWPGLGAPELAALIVGRWPSGAPAVQPQTADPGVLGDDPDNSFDFRTDDGSGCPFGAHIRKVNPRKGPADVVDVPRILRRGIPFGPTFEAAPAAERGLLFLAYQASITGGFEFISGHWMNSSNRPGPGDDVFIGRPFDTRSLAIPHAGRSVTVSTGGRQWIDPTGGGYLFAPGKAGLAALATVPAPLAKFAAPLLLAKATGGARRWISRATRPLRLAFDARRR